MSKPLSTRIKPSWSPHNRVAGITAARTLGQGSLLTVAIFGSVLGAAAQSNSTPPAASAATAALPESQAGPQIPAQRVLVLCNANIEQSRQLARYYAQKRGIPEQNIVALDLPDKIEISRQEFEKLLWEPLQRMAADKKWWQAGAPELRGIDVLCVCKGVPLRMAPSRGELANKANSDGASVDSELMFLPYVKFDASPGIAKNPLYKKAYRPQQQGWPLVLVGRLDAGSYDIAKRILDDSLAVEKQGGLQGWLVVDKANKFPQGDKWLDNITRDARQQGMPVYLDNRSELLEQTLGLPTPLAMYYGWYEWNVSGALKAMRRHFQPGAVAVHIHSFSAASMGDEHSNWCAPLLARGAAVTLGNVAEPFLEYSHHLDVFDQFLRGGHNVAAAALAAQSALSWQYVLFGDPLYRPFAGWKEDPHTSVLRAGKDDTWQNRLQFARKAAEAGNASDFEVLASALCADESEQAKALALKCWLKAADLYQHNLPAQRRCVLAASMLAQGEQQQQLKLRLLRMPEQ